MSHQHAFLAALAGLIGTHRAHLADYDMVVLVQAWCVAQLSAMPEDDMELVAERACDMAERLSPVPERLQ